MFFLIKFCFNIYELLLFLLIFFSFIFLISFYISKIQNKVLKQRLAKISEIFENKTKELQDYKNALAKLINFDPLTELRNRTSIIEMIDLEFKRLERVDNAYMSILVFDIDNFKMLNHRFGQKVGDDILKFFGSLLKENLRKLDIVGRFGVDEFVAILPATDLDGAKIAAEKIRKKVESSMLKYKDEVITFTASCGIASVKSRVKYSRKLVDEFIKSAEEKVRKAKSEGGNRIKF